MSHDATSLERADASDMFAVHAAFRAAMRDAPQLVRAAAAGGRERAEAVADYLGGIVALLGAHHSSEDELVWPRLRARDPDALAMIQQAEDQHAKVHDGVHAAEHAVTQFRADPAGAASSLVAAFASLAGPLLEHLDEEEQHLIPIIERHMTAQEWAELPGSSMSKLQGDQIWLAIGLVRSHMTAEQLAHMDAHMPPPVKQGWKATGRPRFEATMARAHGRAIAA